MTPVSLWAILRWIFPVGAAVPLVGPGKLPPCTEFSAVSKDVLPTYGLFVVSGPTIIRKLLCKVGSFWSILAPHSPISRENSTVALFFFPAVIHDYTFLPHLLPVTCLRPVKSPLGDNPVAKGLSSHFVAIWESQPPFFLLYSLEKDKQMHYYLWS